MENVENKKNKRKNIDNEIDEKETKKKTKQTAKKSKDKIIPLGSKDQKLEKFFIADSQNSQGDSKPTQEKKSSDIGEQTQDSQDKSKVDDEDQCLSHIFGASQ